MLYIYIICIYIYIFIYICIYVTCNASHPGPACIVTLGSVSPFYGFRSLTFFGANDMKRV